MKSFPKGRPAMDGPLLPWKGTGVLNIHQGDGGGTGSHSKIPLHWWSPSNHQNTEWIREMQIKECHVQKNKIKIKMANGLFGKYFLLFYGNEKWPFLMPFFMIHWCMLLLFYIDVTRSACFPSTCRLVTTFHNPINSLQIKVLYF